MKYTKPLTLGQFITKLKQQPEENFVFFEFCDFVPTEFGSWRGLFSELALGYAPWRESEPLAVSSLIALAKSAIGATYTGFKGGQYEMTKQTTLWADNCGEATRTAIVDVKTFDAEDCYSTKIITQWLDYDVIHR